MSQISITISQATPCLCGLKQFSVSYDFKGWPGTPGQFFHGMFAGVTHEFCWGWNIQDGSCGGWASLFSRLAGRLSQWLSTPREQKLSSPLRARPEIDKAGSQSQVKRPAQIPGRRHSTTSFQEEQCRCPRLGGIVGSCLLSHCWKEILDLFFQVPEFIVTLSRS